VRASHAADFARIGAYTLLTGAHPSAVRAALMVGLATLAALTGRVADPLTSLLLAALAMAALEPRVLLDIGLQLSLSATLGSFCCGRACGGGCAGCPASSPSRLG